MFFWKGRRAETTLKWRTKKPTGKAASLERFSEVFQTVSFLSIAVVCYRKFIELHHSFAQLI
jgi:hypothetical protein